MKIEKAEYYFNKANKAYERKDYKTARNDLEKTIKLNPNYTEAYINLAILMSEHFKEFDKARKYYEKVVELNPKNSHVFDTLAGILKDHFQEYEKARKYYEKAIEINPDFELYYYNLANLLQIHFQEYEESKINFEKAIEINVNFEKAYVNLANLLSNHFSQYEQAKKYYEKAIELNPKDALAYNNFAILLVEHFQEYEKARKYYETAIEINPEYANAFFNLANLLYQYFQDYENAKKNYEKVIDLEPEHAYVYNNLASLFHIHFNEYKKAKKYYETAIEINPEYTEVYYNLANLLQEHFQDSEQAEQYFNKFRLLSKPEEHKRVIEISLLNYNQFKKKLKINLTYPKGHKKAGQPLDKICFIGQSGTGKTSLLEIIKSNISGDYSNTPKANFKTVNLRYKFFDKIITKTPLINFPAYGVENIKQLDKDEILEFEDKNYHKIIDFSKTDPKEHWYSILQELKNYQEKAINFNLEISENFKNLRNIRDTRKEIENINKKIEKWEIDNTNLLAELNQFLKPILDKFYLRIKTDPTSLEDLKFVPVENYKYREDGEITSKEIPTQYLSTGTKQILARSIPLYSIKPKNSIILIDEPENSFYPDVQKQYVNFIVEAYPLNQFFFATHSPTIASAFDPWEIVELKFNKTGKVEQKLYYEGERHIDNYTIFPKYLNIDNILHRVFKLDNEIYKEREEKLDKFADYNIKIRKMELKNLQNTAEYKKLIIKRNKLGDKLDWRIEK